MKDLLRFARAGLLGLSTATGLGAIVLGWVILPNSSDRCRKSNLGLCYHNLHFVPDVIVFGMCSVIFVLLAIAVGQILNQQEQ